MIVPAPPEGWVVLDDGYDVIERAARRDLLVYLNRQWVPAQVDDVIRVGAAINRRTILMRWNLDPQQRPWLGSGRRMPVARIARRTPTYPVEMQPNDPAT